MFDVGTIVRWHEQEVMIDDTYDYSYGFITEVIKVEKTYRYKIKWFNDSYGTNNIDYASRFLVKVS